MRADLIAGFLSGAVLIIAIGAQNFSGSLPSGVGARLPGPLFPKPAAWRFLDFLIAWLMFALVVNLLRA